MRVLSLFDGISCGRVAVGECEYFACEIDKYAIQVSKNNFPDIIHLGDVRTAMLPDNIDLLIGGSPCTDLSIAKKDRKGLEGSKSCLFWEYVRVLKQIKPKWFILENVASMPKKDKDIITEAMGVEPIMINAALVSAQSRKRLFWTNIPVKGLPEDRGIMLKDILEDAEKKVRTMVAIKPKGEDFKQVGYIGAKNSCGVGGQSLRVYDPEYKSPTSGVGLIKLGHVGNTDGQANRVYSDEGKSVCLSANGGGMGAKTGLYKIGREIILGDEPLQVLKEGRTEIGKNLRKKIREETGEDTTSRSSGMKAYYGRNGVKANCITTSLGVEGMIVKDSTIRKLTPLECERLQSLPDNYTSGISNTQRYKCLGNAFNVEVIKFILSFKPA